jgi:hypothetical protein
VIPDLARWEDWSVMDRLVEMFKDADDETNWLRVPVITYLQECPLPEAKQHIAELSEIDPDAVRRAEFFAQSLDGFGDEDDSEDEETADTESAETTESSDPDLSANATLDDFEPTSYVVRRVPITSTAASTPSTNAVNPTAADTVPTSVAGASASMDSETGPVAQTFTAQPPTPVAAVSPQPNLVAPIVLIPLGASALIFLVLWSVVSGWFERLIF